MNKLAIWSTLLALTPSVVVFGADSIECNVDPAALAINETTQGLKLYPTCYWTKDPVPTKKLVMSETQGPNGMEKIEPFTVQPQVPQNYRRLMIFFPTGELVETTWGINSDANEKQIKSQLLESVSALLQFHTDRTSGLGHDFPPINVLVGKYKVKNKRISLRLDAGFKGDPFFYMAKPEDYERMHNVTEHRGNFSGTVTPVGLSIIEEHRTTLYEPFSDSERELQYSIKNTRN